MTVLTQRQLNFAVQQTIDFTDPAGNAATAWPAWWSACWICTSGRLLSRCPTSRPCSSARSRPPIGRSTRWCMSLYGLTDEEIRIVEEGGRTVSTASAAIYQSFPAGDNTALMVVNGRSNVRGSSSSCMAP